MALSRQEVDALTVGTYLPLSGGTMTGTLTLNPAFQVNPNDAATVGMVGAVAAFKTVPADCATTANITLSGEQTIDGFATSASRVLVKDQTAQDENGIYLSDAGAWARTTDADTSAELSGAAITVVNGTANAGTAWLQVFPMPTLGVDPIVWQQLGIVYFADGQAIQLSGNTFGLVIDGATLTQSVSGLKVATGNLTTSTTGVTIGSGTNAIVGAGTTVNIQDATTSQPGLLTAADWNTFNTKINGTSTVTRIPYWGAAANTLIDDVNFTRNPFSFFTTTIKTSTSGSLDSTLSAIFNSISMTNSFSSGSAISRVSCSGSSGTMTTDLTATNGLTQTAGLTAVFNSGTGLSSLAVKNRTFVWNWPITQGSAGEVLTTDGANPATLTWSVAAGSGTVTNVSSANGDLTVANPTTTPVLTIVSAPQLTTARTINGTSFDGTANITVTADAGTLTGTTLNPTVVTSSLTSIGTLVFNGLKINNPAATFAYTFNASAITAARQLNLPLTTQTETIAVQPVVLQATPSDPATTTSTTGLMMGLAQLITPVVTGRIHIVISGDMDNSSNGNGAQVQIRTGTGAAPVNGAVLTGTVRGGLVKCNNPTNNTIRTPFHLNAIVTGLTVGTQIWIDVGLAAISGGTARIRDISVSAFEL